MGKNSGTGSVREVAGERAGAGFLMWRKPREIGKFLEKFWFFGGGNDCSLLHSRSQCILVPRATWHS